jgi:riboflavin kinase / FMN adenylyltransferase
MNIYRESDQIKKSLNAVVTVGSFDGLHLGHFKILDEVKKVVKELKGSSYLITFEPHPRFVLSKDFGIRILTSLSEKISILEEAGIENLVILKFTKEFSQLTSDEFIRQIIVDKIGAAHMVIGHDHKFGKDRLGDVRKLSEVGRLNNFSVTDVPPESMDGEIISSTKIRNYLFEGDLNNANKFLGRNYSLEGIVVVGMKRGRTLGFPTANIQPDDFNKVIPDNGIYVVRCKLENKVYSGVMNIGTRPTFENNQVQVLEAHILNFNRDIYGDKIKIEFIKRLRDEVKFASKEDLIKQMLIDKQMAADVFNLKL